MPVIKITELENSPTNRRALGEILVEAVENGAEVSFMHPLTTEAAEAFWTKSLADAERGGRVLLGFWEDKLLIGTVTLLLDLPPNQPHRAEVAKLMTRLSHRGRGVAKALMFAVEQLAIDRSKTLLVLDTSVDGGASALYEKLGYQAAGVIPDYALKPRGGLSATRIYWKRIGTPAFADH